MQLHARTSPQSRPSTKRRQASWGRAGVPAHPVDEKRVGDLSQDEGRSAKTRQETSGLQKRFVSARLRPLSVSTTKAT
jgi:hypothetical protein